MNDRAARQRPAAPNRPGTGSALPSKAEKRTAAKAAKARAAAAAKRRQVLTVAGAAAAVIAVIAVVVVLAVRSDDPATPTQSSVGAGSAASADTTAEATRPAFPPVPEGADPALSTKPAAKAGSGSVSKLEVTTLIEGNGAAAQSGQTITVNYVGVTFADGKEFDSSWRRSQPFSFPLGGGKVIKGWDQGLVGVKVGSRVQLDIPAALAYGDHPAGGAPGGTLRFIVDVLSVA
ncbi:FKBP-type peptidyl-prolyl cis-trans isomerase [Dactylosporangium sp. NPDC000555]|uniref:FKBP-type peptidyl-prolyl cis-trans isomerase n=1 Tax=Dactylosporangium sp. NPDC000555 TaxID=3154260 RepID=UPI00331FDBB2